jgi:dTDP-4-amino-4,6-dideoxygalactose transaminase
LNGESLLNWGDISTCSFHATKLFHTVEGGGVFTGNPEINERLGFLRNFGHHGFDKFAMLGINGKNSEFHAAMGIVNMRYVKGIIQKRAEVAKWYDHNLAEMNLTRPEIPAGCEYNYAYYPVLFSTETSLLQAFHFLQKNEVFARRYFYPSLEKLPYIQQAPYCKVAEDCSRRILCLPFYDSLSEEEVSRICRLMVESQTISTC